VAKALAMNARVPGSIRVENKLFEMIVFAAGFGLRASGLGLSGLRA